MLLGGSLLAGTSLTAEPVTILDCGLLPREMLEELIVGMRQHMGLKHIDAFRISHMHGDHFLLGPLLREKYGAESWTLDRVVGPIENPRHYDDAALISAYDSGFDGMPIDRAFGDGESIEWEGYRIQIDWMPGQTEFGCSLWLEMDGKKIVFTGDNLFGNPFDSGQDGHEAVVARNSCIFEEGYLHAANYLRRLDPDILMGSHSLRTMVRFSNTNRGVRSRNAGCDRFQGGTRMSVTALHGMQFVDDTSCRSHFHVSGVACQACCRLQRDERLQPGSQVCFHRRFDEPPIIDLVLRNIWEGVMQGAPGADSDSGPQSRSNR